MRAKKSEGRDAIPGEPRRLIDETVLHNRFGDRLAPAEWKSPDR
jgi:hypothetical protein